MSSYQLPEGYKMTEVGVIPGDWEVYCLSECCSKITDGTHDTPQQVKSGVPYLTAIHIKKNHIDFENCYFLHESIHAEIFKRCNPEQGDVLMVNIGAGVATTALVNVNYEFSLKNVALLKPNIQKLLGEYLNQSQIYRKDKIVQSLLSGGAQPFLSLGQIGQIKIAIPPIVREQRSIATALSDMDELLGGLDRLITKKRDLKQSAMQQLLTGKTRLPGFDGEWEVNTFGDVAFIRKDRIDPKRSKLQGFCVELEHISSGSGVLIGNATTTEQSSIKSVFSPGDILFGKLRSYLRKYWLADTFGVCSTEIWVLAPKNNLITTEFLFQIVKTDKFVEETCNSYGTHMPRSDWKVVSLYRLPLPPLPEQVEIASILSDMDTEIATLEQRRHKTQELKQAMMQELLTGRIRLV